MESLRHFATGLVLAVLTISVVTALSFEIQTWLARDKSGLPYDRGNPVVYDNDEAVDMYTDEYLLALASLGDVNLKGMITSSPIQPYDQYVTIANYEKMVADREQLVLNAKESGFTNIPIRLRGPMGNLQKPASRRIEDTRPIGAAGSRFIVAEAKKASPQKPLIVVVGGPLTAEADAFLLDPSVADKVIIAWLGGDKRSMCDYNGWADPWAAYVVLTKLRLVQFPLGVAPAAVPKKQLMTLPASHLRDYMYHKHHPTNSDPGEIDGDGTPAISVARRDYPILARHVTFRKWVSCRLHPTTGVSEEHDVPAFHAARSGTALVVEDANQSVSTNEWWKTIRAALSGTFKPNLKAALLESGHP